MIAELLLMLAAVLVGGLLVGGGNWTPRKPDQGPGQGTDGCRSWCLPDGRYRAEVWRGGKFVQGASSDVSEADARHRVRFLLTPAGRALSTTEAAYIGAGLAPVPRAGGVR